VEENIAKYLAERENFADIPLLPHLSMKKSLLLGAAALALVGCQPATPDVITNEPIKIGLIAPLTGDAAGLGADVSNGAQMAVAKINAADGIGGRQIQLIMEDGKCAGADAATAAQKLVNVDKVVAIVGGLCSGETLAAAPIVEAAKVILLSPTSSSPDVTAAGEFVFRNYPSDALKTVAMAKYFQDKGFTKVAIISENTDFSQGFRDSLAEQLPEGTIVFDETVDPGTKDFRTLVTRLKDMEFDVFVPNGNSDAVIGPMIEQLREQGLTQPAVGHDAADSVTMAKDLPEATNNLFVINVASELADADFAPMFEAEYGAPQYGISFAGYASDAVHVLAQAMIEVGTDGSALQQYLLSMPDYTGAVGTFHFDQNGDVVGIPYVLKEYVDGEIITRNPLN
jgi:branched-chain amino acid transport system substrate-binding protein